MTSDQINAENMKRQQNEFIANLYFEFAYEHLKNILQRESNNIDSKTKT